MIKYVKIQDEMKAPCIVCGGKSQIFMVKKMRYTDKYSFYVCEKCFKSFQRDTQEAKVKEYKETDIARILNQAKETEV